MCGILAYIGSRPPTGFRGALDTLSHRGPDAVGLYQAPSGRAALGHRRLAIIDLSEAGNQPLFNEDRSLALVCNGEIYNYPVLRRELERLGHRFASDSDSEVILHAYEEWGTGCLDRFLGMFAFMLHDARSDEIFAARDHAGIKPLCYAVLPDGLLLASDARAILPLLADRRLNRRAACHLLTLGYVPAPLSIWEGVSKLEPGHWLLARDGRIDVRRWWTPPADLDPSLAPEDFPALFEEAVADHLLSDVPVALFLSGGMDSTAVALAAGARGTKPIAFTVSFPDSPSDEKPIAASVAASMGLDHRVRDLSVNDVDALLGTTMAAFDEPQGYSALLSMMLVSRAAAADFKVVLSGDGGDESFAGYTWYGKAGAGVRPRGLLGRLLDRLRPPRPATWSEFARLSPLAAHARQLFPRFLPHEAGELLGVEFGMADMLAPLERHFEPDLPLVRALQRVDLMTFCTDSILAKVDRASMAHSLEVRVPFLDRRVIEFGLRLPVAESHQPKHAVRRYLETRGAPREVMDHPKQGFSLRCLNALDWGRIASALRSGTLVSSGVIPESRITACDLGAPGRVWTLLQFEIWARKWIL